MNGVKAMGYTNLSSLDKLVSMKIHRVDSEFIKEVQTMGFNNVPIDKLSRNAHP